MTKARLTRDIEWYPHADTDFDAFRNPVIEPARTLGTISDCNCFASGDFDFHFYPARLNGQTFFGVKEREIEMIEVI